MNNTELEKRLSDMETAILEMMENRAPRTFWDWVKPYILPFIFGTILGVFWQPQMPFAFPSQPTIEQQAASGGAAIPFPSGSPFPSLSSLPPGDSRAEPTASSLTSTYEPPSPSNPQADAGQTTSARSSRLLLRRIR